MTRGLSGSRRATPPAGTQGAEIDSDHGSAVKSDQVPGTETKHGGAIDSDRGAGGPP